MCERDVCLFGARPSGHPLTVNNEHGTYDRCRRRYTGCPAATRRFSESRPLRECRESVERRKRTRKEKEKRKKKKKKMEEEETPALVVAFLLLLYAKRAAEV